MLSHGCIPVFLKGCEILLPFPSSTWGKSGSLKTKICFIQPRPWAARFKLNWWKERALDSLGLLRASFDPVPRILKPLWLNQNQILVLLMNIHYIKFKGHRRVCSDNVSPCPYPMSILPVSFSKGNQCYQCFAWISERSLCISWCIIYFFKILLAFYMKQLCQVLCCTSWASFHIWTQRAA